MRCCFRRCRPRRWWRRIAWHRVGSACFSEPTVTRLSPRTAGFFLRVLPHPYHAENFSTCVVGSAAATRAAGVSCLATLRGTAGGTLGLSPEMLLVLSCVETESALLHCCVVHGVELGLQARFGPFFFLLALFGAGGCRQRCACGSAAPCFCLECYLRIKRRGQDAVAVWWFSFMPTSTSTASISLPLSPAASKARSYRWLRITTGCNNRATRR